MNRATIEALLHGVPLPASKNELLDYVRGQPHGDEAATLLDEIPEREYRALQDVGEVLEPRQVAQRDAEPPPRPESDVQPGGTAYVGGDEEPANVLAVRDAV